MFGRFNFHALRRFLREQRGSWAEVRTGLRKRWILSCGMVVSAAACAVMLQHLDSLDRRRPRSQRPERPVRPVVAESVAAGQVAEPIVETKVVEKDWEAVLAAQRRMWPEIDNGGDSAGQVEAHQSAWTLIRDDVKMDDNPFVSPANFRTAAETGSPASAGDQLE